jgi:hypothetical protein
MEPNELQKGDGPILPANSMPGVTVEYTPRRLTVRSVTDAELDTVASLSNSVHLAFVGMSFGALLAFSIVLFTVDITDVRIHSAFASLAWLSGVLTLYFGIRAAIDYRAAQVKLREIKR